MINRLKYVCYLPFITLSGCAGLSPVQEQSLNTKMNILGSGANVTQNYFQSQSTMTLEQLITLALYISCINIALGFLLNIAIRYLVNRYGMMLGMIYLLIGLASFFSVTGFMIWFLL